MAKNIWSKEIDQIVDQMDAIVDKYRDGTFRGLTTVREKLVGYYNSNFQERAWNIFLSTSEVVNESTIDNADKVEFDKLLQQLKAELLKQFEGTFFEDDLKKMYYEKELDDFAKEVDKVCGSLKIRREEIDRFCDSCSKDCNAAWGCDRKDEDASLYDAIKALEDLKDFAVKLFDEVADPDDFKKQLREFLSEHKKETRVVDEGDKRKISKAIEELAKTLEARKGK